MLSLPALPISEYPEWPAPVVVRAHIREPSQGHRRNGIDTDRRADNGVEACST